MERDMTFPPKTVRIQRSTSRGLEMAPPALANFFRPARQVFIFVRL
jgi:hypothetical protein